MLHCEFPIGAPIPIFKKCGAKIDWEDKNSTLRIPNWSFQSIFKKHGSGGQECYIVNSQLALSYPFSRNVEQKIDQDDKNATL